MSPWLFKIALVGWNIYTCAASSLDYQDKQATITTVEQRVLFESGLSWTWFNLYFLSAVPQTAEDHIVHEFTQSEDAGSQQQTQESPNLAQ